MHTPAKCQRHDCHNTITRPPTGRRKRFCSDACRIRVHRGSERNETPDKETGQPPELNAPSAVSADLGHFVTSKINDLALPRGRGPVSISGRGIVGPRYVIEAAFIAGRQWEEVTSSSGVRSYVSRIAKPVLLTHSASKI